MPHQKDNIVFVDTSAIAAVMNKTDINHKKAIQVYKSILEKRFSKIITNFVIAETHALLLNKTNNIKLGLHWLQENAYNNYYVIRITKTDEEDAVRLLSKHFDKQWSMVDALSFTIMEKLDIAYYFSFDKDFRQTGKFLDIAQYLEEMN